MDDQDVYYEIRDWEDIYENAASRKCKKLNWVPFPNTHDGAAYRRIAAMDKGPEVMTAFVLFVEVASRQPKRGLLISDHGQPIDTDDMAFKTGFPKCMFDMALDALCGAKINWMIEHPYSADSPLPVHTDDPSLKGMEGNGTEEKIILSKSDMSYFKEFWAVYPRKEKKARSVVAFKKALESCTGEKIIEKAKEYAVYKKRCLKEFIALPTTWLKDGCYDDDYTPSAADRILDLKAIVASAKSQADLIENKYALHHTLHQNEHPKEYQKWRTLMAFVKKAKAEIKEMED